MYQLLLAHEYQHSSKAQIQRTLHKTGLDFEPPRTSHLMSRSSQILQNQAPLTVKQLVVVSHTRLELLVGNRPVNRG